MNPSEESTTAGTPPADRRALEDLAAHLSLALDAGALGTWRWEAATGKVFWDERLERIFGLDPGEFDQTFDGWMSLVHPDDRKTVRATVDRAVAEGSNYLVDHRIVRPDGSVCWLQGRGSVIFDEEGAVAGTIGCAADITEIKLNEQAAHARADRSEANADYERRERERLEFLVGLTDASIQATSHGMFMDLATNAAVPRLGDWCSLFFVPEQGSPIERRVAHADPSKVAWAKALIERYPLDADAKRGVAAVIRTGVTEFIPLVTQELIDDALRESTMDEAEIRPILDVLSLTSVITVPLRTRRGVVGAIQFVSAESGRRYGQDDLALAHAAAGRIAGALENLWLTDQHRNISATLQRSFLPPALPEIPGVEVAVRYCPAGAASEVGGDFYDLFEIGDREWAVVIGDVCGTGPDAAATTVIARHTVRAAARHGQDHDAVLEWINEAVAQSGRYLFCTACYATVTANDDGSFTFASRAGGHPLPVVVRADGRTETLGEPGTLLGVFDEIKTRPGAATLERGDVVFLYTDGITDQPPPYDLREDELVELFRASSRAFDAEAVADDVLERLATLRPMEQRHDDIALIVLRVG